MGLFKRAVFTSLMLLTLFLGVLAQPAHCA
jgi:hypothetical protein